MGNFADLPLGCTICDQAKAITQDEPDQAFFPFGFVSIVRPLLKDGAGAGSAFFCFGFLSSRPRRLLPFAMVFS
ncbi:hypothetical protein CSE45_3914 [Citreicella sp. SE45]|nr:hypothetical protein CSE45_3914 [Citreicella sp. SE45]